MTSELPNLYKKILTFQQQVGAIAKDSTNPYFKSKYFDINGLLAEIKPVLNEIGLVVLQPLAHVEGKPALQTIILDAETNERVENITILPENPDPQKMEIGRASCRERV